MKITFDNYNHNTCCKSLWGFSIYLEKYKLLFDTGSNGRVLVQNLKELDIEVSELKYVFITHSHWDHIGGLDSILELNSDLTIFVPQSLPKHLLADLKTMVKNIVICTEKPMHLFEDIYTTGLIGKKMPEQSLVINDNNPKVITGCGHIGILKITQVANETIDKKIITAIGGFHLMDKDTKDILGVIKSLKKMGVKKVVPTHCTGDDAIELFEEHYKDKYIKGGVGKIIKI